jgi:hypothetical protein
MSLCESLLDCLQVEYQAADCMHVMEESPCKPLHEMVREELKAYQERQKERGALVEKSFEQCKKRCLAVETVGVKVGFVVHCECIFTSLLL